MLFYYATYNSIFPSPSKITNMSTSNVASVTVNLAEVLPKLSDDALRTFLDTGILPNPIPEPVSEPESGDFLACPSGVYSVKYDCWLPGWVYKQGYEI